MKLHSSLFPSNPHPMALRDFLRDTDTPALKCLDISDDNYDWVEANYPRSLRRLSIEYSAGDSPPYAGRGDFLSNALKSLKNLLQLNFLSITNAFPTLDVDYISISPTTLATTLRDVHLSGWAPLLIRLYSHMILPINTNVDLSLRYLSLRDWNEYAHQLDHIFSQLKVVATAERSAVQIYIGSYISSDSEEQYLSFRAWRTSTNTFHSQGAIFWPSPQQSPPFLDIDITVDSFYDDDMDILDIDPFLDALTSEIPDNTLEAIDMKDFDSPSGLLQLISRSSRLCHIFLNSDTGLRALLNAFLSEGNGAFPALRSLEIAHFLSEEEADRINSHQNLEELCQVLASLKKNGRGLFSVLLRAETMEVETLAGTIKSLELSVDFFELVETVSASS
ncbi:hypothetical protein C8Q75DRAFT_377735 [Abortiporus biennis]|nr:hypothetical protein C8Q75DRAFT_377735 [Abortiporus biennis]